MTKHRISLFSPFSPIGAHRTPLSHVACNEQVNAPTMKLLALEILGFRCMQTEWTICVCNVTLTKRKNGEQELIACLTTGVHRG